MPLLLHTNRPACIRLAGTVVGLLLKGGQGICWDTTVLVPAVHREMKRALARRVSHKSVDSEEPKMSIALPWPGVEPVSLDYIQSSTLNHKATQPEAIFSMSLYFVIRFTCRKNQLSLKITSAFTRYCRYGQWFGCASLSFVLSAFINKSDLKWSLKKPSYGWFVHCLDKYKNKVDLSIWCWLPFWRLKVSVFFNDREMIHEQFKA